MFKNMIFVREEDKDRFIERFPKWNSSILTDDPNNTNICIIVDSSLKQPYVTEEGLLVINLEEFYHFEEKLNNFVENLKSIEDEQGVKEVNEVIENFIQSLVNNDIEENE